MKVMKTMAQAILEADCGPASAPLDYGLGLAAIGLGQLVPCRWQPRQTFDAAALLELALDIQQHGVLTPPLVWQNEDGEYELIAGERRIRACYALALANYGAGMKSVAEWVQQIAADGFVAFRVQMGRLAETFPQKAVSVPCRLVTGSAAELHELALVDNLQREDLSAIEEAHALRDLISEYGYTQRQLAERLGKSQTWISQRLTLLDLAPAVADQVTAGEVDPATAREIARLAPDAQAPAIAHLQKHGLKSKAAQAFVGKVLDMSEPAHYTAPGGNDNSARLVSIALAQLPEPADRQRAVVAAAATTGDGKLCATLDSRELLAASGIAGAGKTRYDIDATKLWQAHAPAAGYGCATCQINAQRPLVEETNALADAHKESNRSDIGWPRCAPGVTTCRAYTPAGSAPSLTLCWFGGAFTPTPEEEAHISQAWPRKADDVAVWAAVLRRYYAQADAQAEQAEDDRHNGVRRALARYFELQRSGELAPAANSQHQPCRRCVFHKTDSEDPQGHCQYQALPPDWHDYDTAVCRLWTSGSQTIGRCRLFRLKSPESHLPDLPGGISLDNAGLLHLLERGSNCENYGSARWGPHWLDVKRSKVQEPPSWSACELALAKLLPQLSPGRRLALLLLWEDPFGWQTTYGRDKQSAAAAYVPELGRVVPYTLTETISR